MIKIVGFVKKVNGYRTLKGKMNDDFFINSCKKVAERTGASFASYYTKRQCSKFFRGHGIVYNEIIGE